MLFSNDEATRLFIVVRLLVIYIYIYIDLGFDIYIYIYIKICKYGLLCNFKGEALCKECFFNTFENEIHETIINNKLFQQGDVVAVGASGGKGTINNIFIGEHKKFVL